MPEKFLQHDAAGGFREVQATAVGGGGQENKIPSLDVNGRLDATMMPTGIGAETSNIEVSGTLSAGDFVNVFNDAGTLKARRADASSGVAPANGFVLAAYTNAQTALVYWGGINGQVTGKTPGTQYLSASTPGGSSNTAPSTAGQIVQKIGVATSATAIFFYPQDPILLA